MGVKESTTFKLSSNMQSCCERKLGFTQLAKIPTGLMRGKVLGPLDPPPESNAFVYK